MWKCCRNEAGNLIQSFEMRKTKCTCLKKGLKKVVQFWNAQKPLREVSFHFELWLFLCLFCGCECSCACVCGSSLGSGVVELILPRSIEARLNAAVGPQPPDHAAQLCWHHSLLRRAGQGEQLTGIILDKSSNLSSCSRGVYMWAEAGLTDRPRRVPKLDL